jgi:DNA-binding NarL/FixJ family response regulator
MIRDLEVPAAVVGENCVSSLVFQSPEIAVRLLAEGCRTKEIAEQLEISSKTVETYRSRLCHKLGIDTLAGLVKYAIRAGIDRG